MVTGGSVGEISAKVQLLSVFALIVLAQASSLSSGVHGGGLTGSGGNGTDQTTSADYFADEDDPRVDQDLSEHSGSRTAAFEV